MSGLLNDASEIASAIFVISRTSATLVAESLRTRWMDELSAEIDSKIAARIY